MPTDLVRWGGWEEERGTGNGDADDEWDRPPVADPPPGSPRLLRDAGATRNAERDSAQAERRGDGTFAVARETDAREHRQSAWDWGDARTWLIIGAMCFGFLLFSLWVYFMPQGRHNQNDGLNPTPTIRVY